jgi:hypothetical protein
MTAEPCPWCLTAEKREALSALAESFPSLRGAPGVRPFNAAALAAWADDIHNGPPRPRSDMEEAAALAGHSSARFVLSLLCLVHEREDPHVRSVAGGSDMAADLRSLLCTWGPGDVEAVIAWLRAEGRAAREPGGAVDHPIDRRQPGGYATGQATQEEIEALVREAGR